jgi:hypothetical protein
VPVAPRNVAGPVAVHSASLRLGWKEKEKEKQLAEGVSIRTESVALKGQASEATASAARCAFQANFWFKNDATQVHRMHLRGIGEDEKENLLPPWRHATNSPAVSFASLTRRLFWFLTSADNVTFS